MLYKKASTAGPLFEVSIKQRPACKSRGTVFKAESSIDGLAKARGQFLKWKSVDRLEKAGGSFIAESRIDRLEKAGGQFFEAESSIGCLVKN